MPNTDWVDLLGQFTGTEAYYNVFGNVVMTDGAKFVAEKAHCYWLMDMIGLYANKYRNDEFQVYKLTVQMGLLITIEHTCPDSSECRPYLNEYHCKWYLPVGNSEINIKCCPFCGIELEAEVKEVGLKVSCDVLGIHIA